MSERSPANHNQDPFAHQEMVQFSDGAIGLSFRTKGDVIQWGKHKYAEPYLGSLILVSTESDKRFAIGQGVIVILPEYDKSKGTFGTEGQPVQASRIETAAPGGLQDIVIGEAWEGITANDPVKSVLLEYKITTPGSSDIAQAGVPSPFESARGHIQRVEQLL